MKKINLMIAGTLVVYVFFICAVFFLQKQRMIEYSREYLVEANRIMKGMEEEGCFSMPDLRDMGLIEKVSYLCGDDMQDAEKLKTFFRSVNGYETHIEPLIAEGVLLGIVRFDYPGIRKGKEVSWLVPGMLACSALITLTILVYIRNKIIKPFLTLTDIPYELAKGRLQMEIEESRNRYFGKFVWGISMLRDHLKSSKEKNLKLEKEKKMLLFSISHDIKTPLNSIKLYAKAIKQGVYETEEERQHAAVQIERLSGEMEDFVKEIVKSSGEEIVPIEVENTEFYLKDFISMIKSYYEPKCKLMMTDLTIGTYENKLISGDRDKAFEVVENVMENALKYGDGKTVDITFTKEEDCQLIQIKNTGTPVKTEEIPHLFDSFYRGSNVGTQEGNGLGLYISRVLMRKMNGEIFAQAQVDGMLFVLVFPM